MSQNDPRKTAKMPERRKRNVKEDSKGNILKHDSWSNGPIDSEDDQAGENELLNENTVSPRFVSLSYYFRIRPSS